MHIEVPPRRQHAIGLTPLIDVVFILLIFFMLATSLLDWREIGLATGSSPAEADQKPPAIVRLDSEGKLYYEDSTYTLEELAEVLKSDLEAQKISAAILRPDTAVTLGPTVHALDALAGSGVSNLSLGEGQAKRDSGIEAE